MEWLGLLLLVVAAGGCAMHGGAALGLGLLLPWLGRTDRERSAVHGTIRTAAHRASYWLVAGALLVVALPGLARELLTTVVPVVPFLLAGVAMRAVVGTRRLVGAARWAVSWCAGSWLVTLCCAWVLSCLLLGGLGSSGGVGVLVLLVLVAVVLLVAAHGLGISARELTGRPFERARLLGGPGAGTSLVVLTSTVLAALPTAAVVRLPLGEYTAHPLLVWMGAAALAVAAVAGRQRRRVGQRYRHTASW